MSSFLDRIFHRDMTRNWTPTRSRLDFDLGALTLGGFAVHDPFESLHWLGPASWFKHDVRPLYGWTDLGLVVEQDGERISGLWMLWRSPEQNDGNFYGFRIGGYYEPFGAQWRCTLRGRRLNLDERTTADTVTELFGDKYEIQSDDDGMYEGLDLQYNFENDPRCEYALIVMFDESNLLCAMHVFG